ncbi:MAG: hypothetical protein ABIN91_23620 [Mucilaginibacter sp.]|uniref:hypothetical protein n=1 Tax=Mucilaginibacter sp. TaxID=1882438 RepID=UPI003266B0DC
MQLQVDIGFDQLVKLVKALPKAQLLKLKREINKEKLETEKDDLKTFLLKGPVFSKDQLDAIEETRKGINQWRTK